MNKNLDSCDEKISINHSKDFAIQCLDRIKGLHLQNHLLLLAMMELVHRSKGQDELFNAVCAVANGIAEIDSGFDKFERELLNIIVVKTQPLH